MRPTQSSPLAREKGLRSLFLWVGLIVIGLGGYSLYSSRKAAAQSLQENEKGRENNLLLIQQIEQLSLLYVNRLTQQELKESDREALEKWLLFDQQFVELNRDSPLFQFEVAATARRAGVISSLLGQPELARELLFQSDHSFELLRQESPGNFGYEIENAGTKIALANEALQRKDSKSAVKHLTSATRLMKIGSLLPAKIERDDAIKHTLGHLSELLLQINEPRLAMPVAAEHVAVLKRLLNSQSGNQEYRDMLRAAEARLAQCR